LYFLLERLEGGEVLQVRSFLFDLLPELLDWIVLGRPSGQLKYRQAVFVLFGKGLYSGARVVPDPILLCGVSENDYQRCPARGSWVDPLDRTRCAGRDEQPDRIENLRLLSAWTLEHWLERFKNAVERVEARFGPRFVRT
jgi:hypothetical protein